MTHAPSATHCPANDAANPGQPATEAPTAQGIQVKVETMTSSSGARQNASDVARPPRPMRGTIDSAAASAISDAAVIQKAWRKVRIEPFIPSWYPQLPFFDSNDASG